MKLPSPRAASSSPLRISALLLAAALPAAAGVVADIPVAEDTAWVPEFRKKFGVEVSYYHQEQPYEVSGAPILTLPAIPGGFAISSPTLSNIENELDHAHVKFDWDVLPFLNLFAVAGWVDGKTSLTASGTLGQAIPNPPPPMPIALPFQIDYDGFVYGLGTTLSYGGEHWFTSLTAFYSRTDVNVRSSEVEAFTVMPRVGYKWEKLTAWVGAMYLQTDEEHQGIYNVDFGFGPVPVGYSVNLQQQEDINFLIGLNYEFNENWNATLEAGLGDRESYQISVQWRF